MLPFIIIFLLILIGIIPIAINKNTKKIESDNKSQTEKDRINQLNKKILASHFGFASKGETGENYIELSLFNLNIPKKIIRNAYIPYNGTTSEIDLILITEYGIYVIESKNYSGWIFGSANNKYWTQSLNKHSKYKFYNPILQNRTHINALSNYLNISKNKFNSFIVFSNNSKLKKVPADNKYYRIMYANQVNEYIDRDIKNKNKIFTNEYMEDIYNNLLPTANVTDKIKQEHINDIKQKQIPGRH